MSVDTVSFVSFLAEAAVLSGSLFLRIYLFVVLKTSIACWKPILGHPGRQGHEQLVSCSYMGWIAGYMDSLQKRDVMVG